jgi:hypothetical protein
MHDNGGGIEIKNPAARLQGKAQGETTGLRKCIRPTGGDPEEILALVACDFVEHEKRGLR